MNSSPSQTEDALTAFRQGKLAEARVLYARHCKRKPADADAWFMLGIVEGQLGALPRAERCFRKVIKLQPAAFSAWDNLGVIQMMQARYHDAEKSFRRSLQIKPDNEQAHNGLGNVLRELGKPGKAEQHFQKAIELKPGYAEAYNNLANVLQDRCIFDEAIRCYQKAISLSPGYLDALFNLGATYQKSGEHADALRCYQQVLELNPGFTNARAAIADVYEKQGDYERAHAQLQPLIAQGALPANAAITFATVCRRLDRREEAVPLLKQQLRLPGLPPTLTQELHFSLGDLYNDLEQFDKAFTHYQQANRLRPFPFDEQAQQQQFQCIQETFAAETLPTLARARNTSERPLFIVGMPRSGTSLVEQILASHPQVHGGGELDCMGELLNSFTRRFGQPYPAAVSGLDADALDSLAQAYLEQLDKLSADALRVTDKMPHNFLHLGLIGQLFPHARIIHCQRDPMDTCLSIYFHNFNANHPYASDLTHLGEYYKRYRSLMQHWKQTLTIPILDVQYEALVSDQEQASRRLIDFCGVDWDDQCLRYYESERLVNTPSYAQVRKPVYRSSIGRWRHYAQYLDPLKQALN